MFMDDLKVFKETKEELVTTVGIVDETSRALGMTLGLKKRAEKWQGGSQEKNDR